MENRIWGILTVVFASVIYTLALKYYRKEQHQLCLFYIILGGLILRVYVSMDFYLHEWDERYHALVAKNLLQNPFKPMLYVEPLIEYDYKNWAENHIWVHKQPFPIYTMALSMFVFGANTIALRLPSILLSTISIFATFKIGKILDSERVGILAAFLFSINGLIIETTAGRVATDHVDVFFYSLITLAVFYLLNSVDNTSIKSLMIGALLTAFAILSKWLPALIVLPIWAVYAYQKYKIKTIIKHAFIFISVVISVVLPWQLYILEAFPLEAAWEFEYNKKHIFEALGPHGQPFYFHFDRMRIVFGELVYFPILWLLITTCRGIKEGNYSKLILSIWILIPYLFFSIAITKMQAYTLFCASAIFITTGIFFFELQAYKNKLQTIKSFVLVLLIALPIRYSLERIKPFSIRDRNPEWISNIKKIDRREDKKSVIFNCKYPIEVMFYTNMVAYEYTPRLDEIKTIREKGYEIYMDNYNPIKDDVKCLNFVNYINVTGKEQK